MRKSNEFSLKLAAVPFNPFKDGQPLNLLIKKTAVFILRWLKC